MLHVLKEAVFTPNSESLSSENLSSVEPFKKAVLKLLDTRKITSLKTDEDWLDLRNEVKSAFDKSIRVSLFGIPLNGDPNIIDDVEVCLAKRKPTKTHFGSIEEEVVQARSGLPTSVMDALKL